MEIEGIYDNGRYEVMNPCNTSSNDPRLKSVFLQKFLNVGKRSNLHERRPGILHSKFVTAYSTPSRAKWSSPFSKRFTDSRENFNDDHTFVVLYVPVNP